MDNLACLPIPDIEVVLVNARDDHSPDDLTIVLELNIAIGLNENTCGMRERHKRSRVGPVMFIPAQIQDRNGEETKTK